MIRLGAFAALLAALPLAAQDLPPREVPFQGILDDGGAPVTATTDVTFRLFEATSGGTAVWAETQTVTPGADGVFAVRLGAVTDLPDDLSRPLWLEVAVGSDVLGPRTALGAAPYALGLYGLTVTPDASFSSTFGPNLAGGYAGNVIGPDVGGATISGGGRDGAPNTVTASFSTVGGGQGNTASGSSATVGGGDGNTASGNWAMVGGGYLNEVSSAYATVGGGALNEAGGPFATVSGGNLNDASSLYSTVGGGTTNIASGDYATVPGGVGNRAQGQYSFAAGHYARAAHDGAFVWSDISNPPSDPLVSTAPDQFLVRAAGGVGIGTDEPSAQVHVETGSSGSRPHLLLDETATGGFARLRMANANAEDAYWDLAAGGSGGDAFNIFYWDGASGSNLVGVNAPGAGLPLIATASGASLTQGGVWANASSRALKTDFLAVDPEAVLTTLASVPVTRWRYRTEADDVWHLGPMSQDFHGAFGLGSTDEAIGTVDADGVALVSIQALHARSEAQADEIAAQATRIEALTDRLDAQQAQIDALMRRLDALALSTCSPLASR